MNDAVDPVDIAIGGRIRARREELRITQAQLAAGAGVTFQQIQKYEKGANRISASKLWDIARFFKVDIGYFFEGLGPNAQAGVAEGEAAFDHDYPSTRYSIEISRLAPRLAPRQQKLALELLREMLEKHDEADPEPAAD